MSRSGVVLVNLAKDWFGPNGVLYEVEDNPHEFPAEWAEEVEPEKIEARKKKEVMTVEVSEQDSEQKYAVLPSSAEIVESQATVAVDFMTGGGQKLTTPVAVEDDVERVGGALGEHGLESRDQSVGEAEKVAKDVGLDQVGGKPRESGPLPAGEKKAK